MKKHKARQQTQVIGAAFMVLLCMTGCTSEKDRDNPDTTEEMTEYLAGTPTGEYENVTSSPETKPDVPESAETPPETGSPSGTEPTPDAVLTPEPDTIQITISAAGDVTLGSNQNQTYDFSFHEYYDNNGAEYFLQNVRDIFEADDFTIVNLEGTLTNSEDRREKQWNHRGKPEYVEVLTCSSVEAVTLGNNHIMDYNKEGVADTISTVKNAGIAYGLSCGWGNEYGLYETGKGVKIGFVSVNESSEGKYSYPYLEDGLAALRDAGAHIVIACTHWGDEKTHVVAQDQIDMGRWCIDMGYDLVLGCHPHVLQGIELYNGKYIVYSMGNFCYGGNKNPADKDSMIWQQTFTLTDGMVQPESEARVIPCSLSSVTRRNDFCPIVLECEEAEGLFQRLNC